MTCLSLCNDTVLIDRVVDIAVMLKRQVVDVPVGRFSDSSGAVCEKTVRSHSCSTLTLVGPCALAQCQG